MSEKLKQKMIEHMEATHNLNLEEMEYVKKMFGKEYDLYIFYCHTCKSNTFLNRKNQYAFDYGQMFSQRPITHPICDDCGEYMNRIVINDFPEDAEVKDFFRIPRPQIFCFITAKNVMEEGSVSSTALAEDGEGICSHYSSNEYYAKLDIGLLSNAHHKEYSKKYPEGFELVWVEHEEWDRIPELLQAEKLNFLRGLTKMFKKFKERRETK